MAVRVLPKVRIIRQRRRNSPMLPAPQKPDTVGVESEVLAGTVQGMKASAPEERLARALDKLQSIDQYQFRYTVGAPRGLPGWKELDFLVPYRGLVYAIEVDSAFTHLGKSGRSDVLHDAIVLHELEKQGMQTYPQVIHLRMEDELVDQKTADRTAKGLFQ